MHSCEDRGPVAYTDNRPRPTCISIFYGDLKSSEVGQVDLVFGYDQGSFAGPCTQDYNSSCAAVTICVIPWLTSRQTDIHTAFERQVWFEAVNPLEGRGVNWLHLAIQI